MAPQNDLKEYALLPGFVHGVELGFTYSSFLEEGAKGCCNRVDQRYEVAKRHDGRSVLSAVGLVLAGAMMTAANFSLPSEPGRS